ncbi:unnamed protein product [Arabidopsis halleri]
MGQLKPWKFEVRTTLQTSSPSHYQKANSSYFVRSSGWLTKSSLRGSIEVKLDFGLRLIVGL